MQETTVRYIIDQNLKNKGWTLDPNNEEQNVFFERDLPSFYKNKLTGAKRPDYTLFDDNDKPIGIIEAKKSGENLDKALHQAAGYAKALEAPLIFASNGSYCETRYLNTSKRLKLNNKEVKELLSHHEALKFLDTKSNEAFSLPKEIIRDRDDLIPLFDEINNTLRGEGLRAGIERFSEFANVLFLKLLSEGKKNEQNLWERIKREEDSLLINFINGTLLKELQTRYGGEVLSPLTIQNPKTLKSIIYKLDPLLLNPIDEDIKGGAFEHFLEKTTSTQNDLGEYYTPRHIIKTMVHLVNPVFNENHRETIYDPFCGTGGFLTTAFNHIQNNRQLNKEEKKTLKEGCLYGHELTTTARIAKMNMVLHGDGHSGVEQKDSLLNPIKDKYDIVMTNVPFSQTITYKDENNKTRNDLTKNYYEGLAKNSGDGVCVLHCFQAVKQGGRMAVVVPEGFLFRSKEKQVRSFLLGNANLQSVISLPSGVFNPYTGVKTNILYFTDCHYPHDQKEYWYFDVKNDGFSLGARRRELEGDNDINKINSSNVIYKDEKEKEVLTNTGFELVEMEKVKENDYNLVGSFYREEENKPSKYPLVKLETILDYEQPTKYIVTSTNYNNVNKTPVLTAGKSFILGYTNETEGIFPKEKLPVIIFDDFTTEIKYVDFLFKVKSSAMKILHVKKEKANVKFLFNIMKSIQFDSNTHKRYWISQYSKLQIPLPPLEDQTKIVGELEKHEKVIEGARQVIENYKPQVRIKDEWKKTKLGDACDIINGGTPNTKEKRYWNGDINWATIEDVKEKYLHSTKRKITREGLKNSNATIVPIHSVLFSSRATIGEISIAKNEVCTNQGFKNFICQKNKLKPEFLYYFLKQESKNIKILGTGSTYKEISKEVISKYKIPLPSLEEQNKIVKELEAEEKLIEANKELIKIMGNKIKDKINALWQSN